jgi:hypothetical protein
MIARNLLFVAGCETYSAARYGMSADNVVALKSLAPNRIAVGAFTEAQKFADGCRAAGPITASDGGGFAACIRKAFVGELKIAGVYADSGTVALTGTVEKLAFSSTVACWDIGLTVRSSNGRSVSVGEHYVFDGAFAAVTACKRVADAYFPAVQNTLQKLIASPDFRSLVTPNQP